MQTIQEATTALEAAWPEIVKQSRQVLGSELFYQALVYHCLREHGQVPIGQLGMNVKMRISKPVSALFQQLDLRKHQDYQGAFEPIPDVCLFSSHVNADWRRRNRAKTLSSLLLAIEIKASEREKGRLRIGEIKTDIEKLAAHHEEARAKGYSFRPVVMVIDTAPDKVERMTTKSLEEAQAIAVELAVGFMYLSPTTEIQNLTM
jgi:hypothetical protein